MNVFLILVGVTMIGYGAYLNYNKEKRVNKLSSYAKQMETQEQEFVHQFKLEQEQLENLYGKQLNEMKTILRAIESRLDQLDKPLVPFESQSREDQVKYLLNQGASPSEVAEVLKLTVTEVLLLNSK